MSTISDIANKYLEKTSGTLRIRVHEAMNEYANQQIELAVDKTLEIASERATVGSSGPSHQVDKKSILSLRTQILNEIKDR